MKFLQVRILLTLYLSRPQIKYIRILYPCYCKKILIDCVLIKKLSSLIFFSIDRDNKRQKVSKTLHAINTGKCPLINVLLKSVSVFKAFVRLWQRHTKWNIEIFVQCKILWFLFGLYFRLIRQNYVINYLIKLKLLCSE